MAGVECLLGFLYLSFFFSISLSPSLSLSLLLYLSLSLYLRQLLINICQASKDTLHHLVAWVRQLSPREPKYSKHLLKILKHKWFYSYNPPPTYKVLHNTQWPCSHPRELRVTLDLNPWLLYSTSAEPMSHLHLLSVFVELFKKSFLAIFWRIKSVLGTNCLLSHGFQNIWFGYFS